MTILGHPFDRKSPKSAKSALKQEAGKRVLLWKKEVVKSTKQCKKGSFLVIFGGPQMTVFSEKRD